MNLFMLSVFVVGCVIHAYGQEYQDEINKSQDEMSPPIPTPNSELVNDLRVALDAIFGVEEYYLTTLLLNDDNENVFFSPVGVAAAIGQLILGAEGKLQKQLVEFLTLNNSPRFGDEFISYHNKKTNVTHVLPYSTFQLHLQLSEFLKLLEAEQDPSKHFHLSKNSALFVKNTTVLKDSFRSSIRSLYETRDYPMYYGNVVWKLIQTVHLKDYDFFNPMLYFTLPTENTSSMFVSVVSFKSPWKFHFDPKFTLYRIFTNANKTLYVKFMVNQLEQIPYAESSEYRVIGLPYENEELGMYIILPKPTNQYKYDMKGFLQSVKYREVLDTISKAKRRNVVVNFPKMRLSASLSISDVLKKHRIFDQLDKLDVFLTNAAVGESLHVDEIVQNVKILTNEGGSVGPSEINLIVVDSYKGRAENFDINRPFIFFVRHEATSATLFWGAVTDPTAGAGYWDIKA